MKGKEKETTVVSFSLPALSSNRSVRSSTNYFRWHRRRQRLPTSRRSSGTWPKFLANIFQRARVACQNCLFISKRYRHLPSFVRTTVVFIINAIFFFPHAHSVFVSAKVARRSSQKIFKLLRDIEKRNGSGWNDPEVLGILPDEISGKAIDRFSTSSSTIVIPYLSFQEALKEPERRFVKDSKTRALTVCGGSRFASHWFIFFNDVFIHSQVSRKQTNVFISNILTFEWWKCNFSFQGFRRTIWRRFGLRCFKIPNWTRNYFFLFLFFNNAQALWRKRRKKWCLI